MVVWYCIKTVLGTVRVFRIKRTKNFPVGIFFRNFLKIFFDMNKIKAVKFVF